MNKAEFLKALKEKLLQEMDSREVESNVRYYSDYIDDAVRNGKNTQEVLDELGDPILIARTILETYDGNRSTTSGIYEEPTNYGYHNTTEADEVKDSFRQFQTKGSLGCLVTIIVMIAILAVLMWLFGAVFRLILPILLPVVLVVFFIKLFKK